MTIKLICATWVYSFLWTLASTIQWSSPIAASSKIIFADDRWFCLSDNPPYYICVYSIVYIIPLVAMAVIYALILSTALEQQRMMSSLSPSYLRRDDHTRQKRKQEVSASKTVAVIYGAFTVCWLPAAIMSLIFQNDKTYFDGFKQDYPEFSAAIFIAFNQVLPAIHSCLNPFIYIIFHQKFRTAFKALLSGRLKSMEEVFRSSARSSLKTNETVAL